ncbi:MAG: alpha/beta fold hydrolase [Gemmatimonadaceae bacterium]|nr:alpha/beta fold hydrolase [Gemmatimonadaceae bacterium]
MSFGIAGAAAWADHSRIDVSASHATALTASHRGGRGSPMVLLHGFTGSWRVWALMLAQLERHHDVFAPTLPGHAGGPPIGDRVTTDEVLDAVERMLDEAGVGSAHLVGNSLGGYIALRLAQRGRAESVVALAPAGGWVAGDPALAQTLALFPEWQAAFRALAPHADAITRTPEGRRRATAALTVHYEHLAPELVVAIMNATAFCPGTQPLIDTALREGYELDPERITCPVRVVWGTADALLPWPSSAVRYRQEWLPHADWVELDSVGHCPQLDVPLEAAQLILGFTAR